MKEPKKVVVNNFSREYGTLKNYVVGYLVSIVFTITAYLLVTHRATVARSFIIIAIVTLAISQFLAQLYLFLHLGKETKPRWKLFVFCFMVMVVLILVFGSLWIMNNLNYRMTPSQVNTYLNNQGGGF